MGTTAVVTSVATRGEVHGAFTMARAVPSKAYGTKATTQAVPSKFTWTQAQASHSHAPRTEQPAPVIQPAPAAQPALMASQAAQVDPRQSQPSGIIEAGVFSAHFSADLTFPNSNLALGVNHPSIVQGGAFHPSSSNPNGEQNLSRQVIELTSTFVQQTTLVNQLLQRAHDEVSRSKTRADDEPLKQRPGK
ncbi:hypothetical protein TB1_037436 [Malus domestica]